MPLEMKQRRHARQCDCTLPAHSEQSQKNSSCRQKYQQRSRIGHAPLRDVEIRKPVNAGKRPVQRKGRDSGGKVRERHGNITQSNGDNARVEHDSGQRENQDIGGESQDCCAMKICAHGQYYGCLRDR